MTTAPASRARRRAALLAAAASSTLLLSGCLVNSPTTTQIRYAPADGVEIDGTSIDVRDLLVVSHGNGSPGVVLGSVVNQTSEEVTVTVSAGGTTLSPEVTIGPNSHARLDGTAPGEDDGERVSIPSLETPAGQSVEISLSTGTETVSANAPVLLPAHHYEQFADEAGGTVEPRATGDDDH